MRDYILSYDVCSLIFLTIFAVFYFSTKRVRSAEGKLFSLIVWIALLTTVLDIAATLTVRNTDILPIWFCYAINCIYFAVVISTGVLFSMYASFLTKADQEDVRLDRRTHFIQVIPYIIAIALNYTTPIHKLVFYFDENKKYVSGKLMFLLPLIEMIYFIAAIVGTIQYQRKNIQNKHKSFAPIYTFAGLATIAVILQQIFPNYLLYSFAVSIGIFAVYLTQMNYEEMLDSRTNLFNRKALQRRLNNIITSGENYVLVGVSLKYRNSITDDDEFNMDFDIIDKLAGLLKKIVNEMDLYCLENCTFAILSQNKGNTADEIINHVRSQFTNDHYFSGKEKLTVALDVILIPEQSKNPIQLLSFLELGIVAAKERTDNKVIYGSELQDAKERKINQLMQRQNALLEANRAAEKAKEEALAADKSKTMFLTQMSHEIRTPMTAILGMTELILRESKDSSITSHAISIQRSGNNLRGIINDILDFSKIESGKMNIIEENYYTASIIQDVINNVVQKMIDKRLHFKIDFDPNIPSILYGDEMRIKQIVINLLSNAVKYTEEGSVNFDISWKQDPVDKNVAHICFRVKDTGLGIREENISKLFDSFSRFDQYKNKAIEGSGLGLAICKQLTEAMHGNIQVESVYGEGSTFIVNLPQKIIDRTASVVIEEPEKVNMLIYSGDRKICKDFTSSCDSLGIKNWCTTDLAEFNNLAMDTNYTHLIIDNSNYELRASTNDALLQDPRLVVSVRMNQYMRNRSNVRTINLPVNSITIGSMILGRDLANVGNLSSFEGDEYVAPDVRILVVDDNGVNISVFTGLLEHHRMQIDTANSGNECVAKTLKCKYDIVFLDHMMPGKDGIQTFHEINDNPSNPNHDTPFIAFTANAVSGMKDMFLNEGFADFLSKPIEIVKLEELLRTYLPRELMRPFDPELDSEEEDKESKPLSFNVEGVDMNLALAGVGGSYEKLEAVLRILNSDGNNRIERLSQFAADRNLPDYRIEIHALKSVSASVGEMNLSAKAKALETAAAENNLEFVEQNHEEALELYRQLLTNVGNALIDIDRQKELADAENGQENSGLSGLEATEQLTLILSLLHEYEEELAEKLVNMMKKSIIDEELKEKLKEISDKLALFDYDEAARLVEEAIQGAA